MDNKINRTKYGRLIRISNESYEQLSKLGTVADTFDCVIRRLLKRAGVDE